MKEFIKDVGWDIVKFTGALLVLVAGLCVAALVIAPMILVCGAICENIHGIGGGLLLTAFIIVYWAIVANIVDVIWRKFTGQPKRERGYIYFK